MAALGWGLKQLLHTTDHMNNKSVIVNVFANKYERWQTRSASLEELTDRVKNQGMSMADACHIKTQLINLISTHSEAASYLLLEHADNGLAQHIEKALESSTEYRQLLKQMPKSTPKALTTYQSRFSDADIAQADNAIKAYGILISEGQILFHGGHWTSHEPSIVTLHPFSTSFCPQVALRNAEWKGKAYNSGRIDLMVVRVTNPKTKAYVYNLRGKHAHEKEVVFASGALLTRVRETFITNYTAYSNYQLTANVPAYVIEVEVS